MRRAILGCVSAAVLAAFTVGERANAAVTIWEYEGTVVEVSEEPGFDPFPGDFVVGMPFRAKIEFDTTETPSLVRSQGGGTRYDFQGSPSLRFNIYLGTTCNPCVPDSPGFVIIRDNVPVPFFGNAATNNGPAYDGYTFGTTTSDGTQIQLNTRGPVLDIVSGGQLPEFPDPRLADLETSILQICVPGEGCVTTDVTAINRRSFRTTWEIQGTIDEAGNSAEFESLAQPGERFRVLIDLDIETVLDIEPQVSGTGKRYDYSARTMSYKLYIGDDGPFDIAFENGAGTGGGIIVRDNAQEESPSADGYSPYLVGFDSNDGGFFTDVGFVLRGPVTDIVSGVGLPATPDGRLGSGSMDVRALQICRWQQGASREGCPFGFIVGTVDSVSAPAFGTNYFLSARDCMRPTRPSDPYPDDCVSLGYASVLSSSGGGLGRGEFAEQFAPASPWTGPNASLGSAFGAISFSGPATLPVVKGQSMPSDISRTNSNLQAYQLYRYEPSNQASLAIPLVIGLTYQMADYSDPAFPTLNNQVGLRPGGAQLSTVLAIVDGDRVPMASIALANFNSLQCGREGEFQMPDRSAWPAGSILGAAVYTTPEGQQTNAGDVTVPVSSCANPGQPVQLSPGQRFVVVTSMQAPARGKESRINDADDAEANGFVDSANTMRVKLDPAAPPALVQALADSIEPECVDCGFVTDVLGVTVDVKPDSADNCLNPGSSGVIPVALLGADNFDVRSVRLDDTLRLGTKGIRVRGTKPLCSVSSVNGDAFDDMLCHFENGSNNWTPGQTTASVTGKLADGTPFEGVDRVCLVQ